MSKKKNDYDKAYDKYTETVDTYNKESKKAYEDAKAESKQAYDEAKKESEKYVGDEGYERALKLGKKGAISASNSAISQGVSSARAGGMNKAQANALGNQSAINAYNNQLYNQQANAYGSGQDAVSTAYNRANALSGVYGNTANALSGIYGNTSNLYGNAMNAQQAEVNNRFNRGWGIVGGIGSLLTSDERLKKYKDISTSFCYNTTKNNKDSDSIMKFKIDLSKYKKGE